MKTLFHAIALATALWLSLSTSCPAGQNVYLSGSKLVEFCTGLSGVPYGAECIGFILGVSDTVTTMVGINLIPERVCLPEGARADQLAAVVTKYLAAHPEELHFTAASLVIGALAIEFPCRG